MVNNDATISFKGSIYEVSSAYIRPRVGIDIRHPADAAYMKRRGGIMHAVNR